MKCSGCTLVGFLPKDRHPYRVIGGMKTIYAVAVNDSRWFFETQNAARVALRVKRDEISRRGVNFVEDTPDKFSFYFGWEERGATWRVIPVEVFDNHTEIKHFA